MCWPILSLEKKLVRKREVQRGWGHLNIKRDVRYVTIRWGIDLYCGRQPPMAYAQGCGSDATRTQLGYFSTTWHGPPFPKNWNGAPQKQRLKHSLAVPPRDYLPASRFFEIRGPGIAASLALLANTTNKRKIGIWRPRAARNKIK